MNLAVMLVHEQSDAPTQGRTSESNLAPSEFETPILSTSRCDSGRTYHLLPSCVDSHLHAPSISTARCLIKSLEELGITSAYM